MKVGVFAALVGAMMAAAPATAAVNFTFSFVDNSGNTVEGSLNNVNDDGSIGGATGTVTTSQYAELLGDYTIPNADADPGVGFTFSNGSASGYANFGRADGSRLRVSNIPYASSAVYNAGASQIQYTFNTNSTFGPVTSVSAGPEPETWAMLILGFGMVGGTLRRRRRVAARAAMAV